MRKLLLLFSLFFTFSFNSQTLNTNYQTGDCLTKPPKFFNGLHSENTPLNINLNEQLCYKIYVHAFTRMDNTGGLSSSEINSSIDLLKNDFAALNISFKWDNQIQYIPISDQQFENMGGNLDLYSHTDGIDIFYYGNDFPVDTNGDPNGNGFAQDPGNLTQVHISGSSRYAPHSPLAQTSVVAHEVGHVLGLFHTHAQQEIPFSVCHGEVNGWEPTNDNSKCRCIGDFVCDTPVDPGLSGTVSSDCVWSGQQSTYFPNPLPEPISNYDPPIFNIMSYTHDNCRQEFTPQQNYFMRGVLNGSITIGNIPYKETLEQVLTTCDTNNCSNFPKVYDGFDTLGSKQTPFNISTDSENNLIVSGRKSTPSMTFEGLDLAFDHFVAKYTQEGCLLWIKEVNGYTPNNIVDSQDNIITIARDTGNHLNVIVSKFNKNGVLLWENTLSNNYYTFSKLDLDNNIYLYNSKNVYKINNNGNIQNISTGIPDDISISSSFIVSNDGLNAFIKVRTNYTSNPFNFAGSTIPPATWNSGDDFYLLKYTFDGNTLAPHSYIQSGHGELFYNNNTNRLILNDLDNNQKLKFYNNNLTLILETDKPSSYIYFSEENNNIIFFNPIDDTLHTLIDDGASTTFDILNLNLNGVGESYPNLVQSENELIYLAGTKPPYYEHYISKIDPQTGQLLARTTNTKIAKEDATVKEKTSFVTLFPNPTKSSVTIATKKEIVQVQLLSKNGVPIIFNNKVFNKEFTLSIENLPTDIYIVKVLFKDGTLEEQKLIKE